MRSLQRVIKEIARGSFGNRGPAPPSQGNSGGFGAKRADGTGELIRDREPFPLGCAEKHQQAGKATSRCSGSRRRAK